MSNVSVVPGPVAADVVVDGATVASYVVVSDVPAVDTPKPFLHPVRTLGGTVITGFAPDDHPWHHGLQFAFPRVGDHNLWGGGTYLGPEGGYQVGDDHGQILHASWDAREASGDTATLAHTLSWLGRNGEVLLHEERSITCAHQRGSTEALIIDFVTTLRNATAGNLELATPAQRGRADGGYGGLFLRLAEGFTASGLWGESGKVTASGASSRTLVVHGASADGAPVTLGLSFLPDGSPGCQKWLYRFEEFAAIGWAVAYDDSLELPRGEQMRFAHRLVVCDGHLDPGQVTALL